LVKGIQGNEDGINDERHLRENDLASGVGWGRLVTVGRLLKEVTLGVGKN
jgi:hypothetical protein